MIRGQRGRKRDHKGRMEGKEPEETDVSGEFEFDDSWLCLKQSFHLFIIRFELRPANQPRNSLSCTQRIPKMKFHCNEAILQLGGRG